MNERFAVLGLALLSLLSLMVAPWAALNRELGAKSAVLLLPNRFIDFTGRTEPVSIAALQSVLLISLGLLLLLALSTALRSPMWRRSLWVLLGLALIAINVYGLRDFDTQVIQARYLSLETLAQQAFENPSRRTDVEALQAVIPNIATQPLNDTAAQLNDAGVRVRRLPYNGAGLGLACFLLLVTGGLTLLLGARVMPLARRVIDAVSQRAAIPLTSLLLALLAAAVVILALQPTPIGRGVEVSGFIPYLAGRLDTLWYAYVTLFANSLGTLGGFLNSLSFATPLIFTGLAVAFSFRAGLFNIGAPGQMILGAIFAMLVGIYMPGPKLLVLPLAVLASAVGGGLWGALPGWLKARFGANEVINTILLNYIAASLMLFLLSSQHTFAAGAWRGFVFIGLFVVALIILSLVPALRHLFSRAPRVWAAGLGVALLLGLVVCAWPRTGDAPYTFTLPFKAEGSEPKSKELQESAHLMPYSDLVENAPPTLFNGAFLIALLAALLVYLLLWRTKWGYELRAVGLSPKAAEYAGVHLGNATVLTMAISGALAGLTATHYVLGGAMEGYSLRQSLPTNDGFDGIAVALLGYNTPVGVLLSAFLFGVLKNGGLIMNTTFPELTRDVVSMILALVVLFIAAKGFLPAWITNPKLRLTTPPPSQPHTPQES